MLTDCRRFVLLYPRYKQKRITRTRATTSWETVASFTRHVETQHRRASSDGRRYFFSVCTVCWGGLVNRTRRAVVAYTFVTRSARAYTYTTDGKCAYPARRRYSRRRLPFITITYVTYNTCVYYSVRHHLSLVYYLPATRFVYDEQESADSDIRI